MARRSKENAIDWDAIEKAFRLGTKSNKQLAEQFGVQPSSIGRRAEKYGWVVDKAEEVDAVRNSLLIQAASGKANPNATPSALDIKAAGQVAADVVLAHRSDIGRTRGLFQSLLGEVETATLEKGSFEMVVDQLRKLMGSKDDEAFKAALGEKIYDLIISMQKLTSVHGRIDAAKKLTEILEKVVRMEREAFGIDTTADKPAFEYEALMKKVHALKK